MDRPTTDLLAEDALLDTPDAACCAGACGPMFETPLLEQHFHRIRDAVTSRSNPAPTQTTRPAAGPEGRTADD